MNAIKRIDPLKMFLVLSVLAYAAWWLPAIAQSADPSVTKIRGLLDNAYVLYALMILGSLVSMLKQWGTAKMDGSTVTVGSYLSHLQEIATTLFGNTLAFLLLVDNDMLNFVSAVSVGYVISSASDLNPLGSRSTALKKE